MLSLRKAERENMDKILKTDKLKLGVCYYPEHWPENMWEEDLKRMKKAGIHTVRVAEFAWNLTEPEDGVFVFDFWDKFLDLAQKMEVGVIFGTPTATPPAWLTEKHPEILNCDHNGLAYHHGSRRHYSYNSVVYQEYCKRIVTVLAKRYGHHPAIIGWQLDNEFNCHLNEFYSEADDLAFRQFVKARYVTLDRLNEAWGTVFWNQTYTAWSQVHIPYRVVDNAVNPHLQLDYYRFVSDSVCRFAKMQSDILRKYCSPDMFITTNGLFGNLDNHQMTQESLDFMTYDSYPNFAFDMHSDPLRPGALNDRNWGWNLTEMRSISPVFGIMEQQSGANGWNCSMEAPAPKPGQLKLWTMQSVAHGADFVSYFRWRTCTKGTEIYWHGILDYNNRDNRKLAEVCEVRDGFEALKDMAQSRYQAAFAVLKDYDNVWDAQLDRWHGRLDRASLDGIFRASQLTHIPMDFKYLSDSTTAEELAVYPVLIYPHPAIMTEARAQILKEYVNNGGILVLGCRSGYKDINGQCVMMPSPGLLAELAGADVTDFTFIGPADQKRENVIATAKDMPDMAASLFVDIMQTTDEETEVIGRYAEDYYQGQPALVKKAYGKGAVYTLGTTFSERNARVILEILGIKEPHKELFELPETCELAVREKDGKRWYFVLNYQREAVEITLKKELKEVISQSTLNGKVTIPPFGVRVFTEE